MILDAEDVLSALDNALTKNDPNELAQAIRHGRSACKEFVARRTNHMLTPLSAMALEQLFSKIRKRIHAIEDKLLYPRS